MPPAHRHGDPRSCGATTTVVGQSSTFVEGKLWAVQGDPNSHGAGALTSSVGSVLIEGKAVIVHAPDSAAPDNLCPTLNGAHCSPQTAGGSGSTYAGG
jgi:hypothetical protein